MAHSVGFGLWRRSSRASATTSGRSSAMLLRPSHLPVARFLRSRAPSELGHLHRLVELSHGAENLTDEPISAAIGIAV
jgi:hypothetical protein